MYFQAKDYSPVPTGTKVAFIGLGTMGFPMAGHLLHAGCQVTVYNRTASKAQAWVEKFGGKAAARPREAAEDADVVFTCVGNDSDLRSVLLGENGAFAGMKKDAVLWDATTDSAEVAKEMAAEAQSRGLHFVDAPVSGGQDGAVSGSLTVMCGGDAEIIERVKPIADAFACSIRRIGPVGSGQLAKMCNQICIAVLFRGWPKPLLSDRRRVSICTPCWMSSVKAQLRPGKCSAEATRCSRGSLISGLQWIGCVRI